MPLFSFVQILVKQQIASGYCSLKFRSDLHAVFDPVIVNNFDVTSCFIGFPLGPLRIGPALACFSDGNVGVGVLQRQITRMESSS